MTCWFWMKRIQQIDVEWPTVEEPHNIVGHRTYFINIIEPFDKISCQNCYGQKSTISIKRIACFSANINAEYNTLSAFKTYGASDSWALGPVSSIHQQMFWCFSLEFQALFNILSRHNSFRTHWIQSKIILEDFRYSTLAFGFFWTPQDVFDSCWMFSIISFLPRCVHTFLDTFDQNIQFMHG